MKALSIREPWISMIIKWIKRIETRSWNTNYRGPVVLCGSKKPYGKYSGLAACIVDIVDSRPMEIWDQPDAQCNYYHGAHAWILDNLRILEEPFPVKGKLGFFNLEDKRLTRFNKKDGAEENTNKNLHGRAAPNIHRQVPGARGTEEAIQRLHGTNPQGDRR